MSEADDRGKWIVLECTINQGVTDEKVIDKILIKLWINTYCWVYNQKELRYINDGKCCDAKETKCPSCTVGGINVNLKTGIMPDLYYKELNEQYNSKCKTDLSYSILSWIDKTETEMNRRERKKLEKFIEQENKRMKDMKYENEDKNITQQPVKKQKSAFDLSCEFCQVCGTTFNPLDNSCSFCDIKRGDNQTNIPQQVDNQTNIPQQVDNQTNIPQQVDNQTNIPQQVDNQTN